MSHLFTLSLVYSFSFGFGGPVSVVPPGTLVSSSLAELAQHCENKFLVAEINSVAKTCSVNVPPYKEIQLQCLTFFDINKQLCNAVSHNRLVVDSTTTTKINDPIKTEKLCGIAKAWTVMSIPEYPLYKSDIEKVFNISFKCAKVCSSDDMNSDDANYFCKYYKWGSELLAHQVSALQPPVVNEAQSAVAAVPQNGEKIFVLAENTIPNPSLVPNVSNTANTSMSPNTDTKPAPSEVQSVNKDENAAIENDKEDIQVPDQPQLQSGLENEVIDSGAVEEASPVKPETGVEAPERPPPAEIPQEPVKPKVDDTLKAPEENKEVQNSDKDKVADPEDYPDSEDGKDGLGDTQGGDDGDGDGDILNDPDVKPEPEIDLNKINTPKRVEAPMSSFNGDIDVYPNTIQDGFADDDDHFFPFFLTAVVLIVLLYVLYHNKSKVSKVVLGLIVEGRQSGRRRNSRGHAYRRLDTLEQAMSTNSTAPPSKIIY